MFKRLFQSDRGEAPRPEAEPDGASAARGVMDEREERNTPRSSRHARPVPGFDDSFEEIYENAVVKPPSLSYGILKVADMMSSPHLTSMSVELKRSSILMALDAAGAETGRLLEDAVFRQRALNDCEEALQEKLEAFEAVQASKVGRIRAELDRLTEQHMAQIQASLDEVAREQDNLRDWKRRKQAESQRIAEAASYCVPKNSTANEGFATLLERGSGAARRSEVAK